MIHLLPILARIPLTHQANILPTRAKATRFILKKKGKEPPTSVIENAKDRARLLETFERYGKVLRGNPTVKPQRSAEELEIAKTLTLNRQKRLQERVGRMHQRETLYIKLRTLAYEELPTEYLKEAAMIPDETPYPKEMHLPLREAPTDPSKPLFGVNIWEEN